MGLGGAAVIESGSEGVAQESGSEGAVIVDGVEVSESVGVCSGQESGDAVETARGVGLRHPVTAIDVYRALCRDYLDYHAAQGQGQGQVLALVMKNNGLEVVGYCTSLTVNWLVEFSRILLLDASHDAPNLLL